MPNLQYETELDTIRLEEFLLACESPDATAQEIILSLRQVLALQPKHFVGLREWWSRRTRELRPTSDKGNNRG